MSFCNTQNPRLAGGGRICPSWFSRIAQKLLHISTQNLVCLIIHQFDMEWPNFVEIGGNIFEKLTFLWGHFTSILTKIGSILRNSPKTYAESRFRPNMVSKNNPHPAGVFGRTRPAGGGADSATCLTPKRIVVERRGKWQTKALYKKNLKNTKNYFKRLEVRSGSGQRSKLQVSTLLASEPNWRSADRHYSLRTRPEVSKTTCRIEDALQRSRSRSGQVTKDHLLDEVGTMHVLWVILPIESKNGTHLVIWAT